AGSSTSDAPFFDWQPEIAATTAKASAGAIPGKVRSGFPSAIAQKRIAGAVRRFPETMNRSNARENPRRKSRATPACVATCAGRTQASASAQALLAIIAAGRRARQLSACTRPCGRGSIRTC
ncbi:MAG: hypothetical protein E5X23_30295, partial [Mesorhizobium sp.]